MISRRNFIKSSSISALSLLLTGCNRQSQLSANKIDSQYNVLFICVDDLNDWVGCLAGHPDAKTPNIDKLASRGVLFTNAFCPAPLCGPSRAAILSGMSPSTTGLYDNKTNYHDVEILRNAQNLPKCFSANGYVSMGAGKVFHGFYPYYWDDCLQQGARLYQAGQPKKNGTDIPGIFDWGPLDAQDSEMDDYRMAQYAIDKLNNKYNKPFFLATGIYLPHAPWYAPRKYFEQFSINKITMPVIKKDDLNDIPPAGRKVANLPYTRIVNATGKQAQAVQAYLACICFADSQVGRILNALEQSQYKDNTIVVLFGDNGLHLGEKNKWHKDSLWTESARIPFIMSVPGLIHNQKCTRPVSLIDIYPTLVELCKLNSSAKLEGRSLAPLLKNPQEKWNHFQV